MIFRRRKKLNATLDERVKEARAEAEESQRRLATTREEVVGPLRELADRNRFAELIRASIVEGHKRQ